MDIVLRGGLRFGGWRAGRVMKIADPRITTALPLCVKTRGGQLLKPVQHNNVRTKLLVYMSYLIE